MSLKDLYLSIIFLSYTLCLLFYHNAFQAGMEFGMKIFKAYKLLSVLFFFQCIVLLTGCNKIIDWGKANFKQAAKYGQDFVKRAKPYLRSTIVYKQFTTIARFDTLFLTDQVRTLYVDYHKVSHGLAAEQESVMRKRLMHENKLYVSFYVVASQKEHSYATNKALFTGSYQKESDILGSKDASFNVYMKVGSAQYYPESIKVVDLPLEYKNIFSDVLDQFSTVYLVRFAMQNSQGHAIFEPMKKYNVALKFTSAVYQVESVWNNLIYTRA